MKRSSSAYSDSAKMSDNKRPRVSGMSEPRGDEYHEKDEEKIPRKVLHIRGLADEMEASDIVQFAVPFGRIRNMVFAKKKHQALLELEDLDSAKAMVGYYKDRPPKFGRKTIYIQFSNYDELDKDLSTQHVNVIKAVQAANGALDHPGRTTPVLRVFIENMIHPVTLNALKQIFSKFGDVQKIVTFTKNSIWQALVQMPDVVAAQSAKNFLNGKNIYDGCCTLRIEFSRQESLSIRYNNDKSFDFTNPNLPQGMDNNDQDLSYDPETGTGILGNPLLENEAMKASGLLGPGTGFGGLLGHEGQMGLGGLGNFGTVAAAQLQLNLLRELSSLEGMRGGSGGANILEKLQGFSGLAGLTGIGSSLQSSGGFGELGLGDSLIGSMGGGRYQDDDRRPGRNRDFSLERGDRRMERVDVEYNRMSSSGGGRVILVSNLNEEKINTDAIFILFGVYGNVLRVKILYNKKDSALIEYEEDYQARDAVDNLNRVRWHDKSINVVISKHATVKMPKDGSEEPWLTKDFTGSKLHRFRKSNSKNHRHIFPPSSTLHLSNIPPTTSEQTLTDLFKEYGPVASFKFSPNDKKIAWIKMDSTQSAIEALVGLHDHELARTSHLRVSFTGYTL